MNILKDMKTLRELENLIEKIDCFEHKLSLIGFIWTRLIHKKAEEEEVEFLDYLDTCNYLSKRSYLKVLGQKKEFNNSLRH